MERTEIRESILDILQDINEDVDYESENKLVADEVLDSFDLITLASEIGEEFDMEISPQDIVKENFNSVDSITDMVIKSKN